MDAEKVGQVLRVRDAALIAAVRATDDFQVKNAELRELLGLGANGHIDAPEMLETLKLNGVANGNGHRPAAIAAPVATAKRKYTRRELSVPGEVTNTRKFPAPFRSATGPAIIAMLARGKKRFEEIAARFEKEMGSEGVHAQLSTLRGLNYIDREGDGYALKPAGREWLNQNGEGK